eukprot:NODE_1418_length_1169_cov_86.534821_g1162_i0.p2 GENE.NODE_1418_length_1169_cov_86.534821_g1162_i0~~NODE_1418_length_1169_cov_86.534821_g1162_i0.p2  ORF type:complete len:267 (+),score=57.85 NODE_1418_length_1169_cov_86.534821_g1162_i0:267-1067(+)
MGCGISASVWLHKLRGAAGGLANARWKREMVTQAMHLRSDACHTQARRMSASPEIMAMDDEAIREYITELWSELERSPQHLGEAWARLVGLRDALAEAWPPTKRPSLEELLRAAPWVSMWMSQTYKAVFRQQDELLSAHAVALLPGLRSELPSCFTGTTQVAVQLECIWRRPAPDGLADVVETLEIIHRSLQSCDPETVFGVDHTLPVLIYALAQSSLPQIWSHIEYMIDCVDPRESNATGYALVTLGASLEFILEKVDGALEPCD